MTGVALPRCSYASLYFVTCVDKDDNELLTLEIIHHFVEVLDRYFGNVCELDIIFNFHKVRARFPLLCTCRGAIRVRRLWMALAWIECRAVAVHCWAAAPIRGSCVPPCHGAVCRCLNCAFRPAQAYYILDEVLLGGELQESNKREVLRVCAAQDDLMMDDEAKRVGTAAGPGGR